MTIQPYLILPSMVFINHLTVITIRVWHFINITMDLFTQENNSKCKTIQNVKKKKLKKIKKVLKFFCNFCTVRPLDLAQKGLHFVMHEMPSISHKDALTKYDVIRTHFVCKSWATQALTFVAVFLHWLLLSILYLYNLHREAKPLAQF